MRSSTILRSAHNTLLCTENAAIFIFNHPDFKILSIFVCQFYLSSWLLGCRQVRRMCHCVCECQFLVDIRTKG